MAPSAHVWWWKIAQHLDEAQSALSNAMTLHVEDPSAVQALQDKLREGQGILLGIFQGLGLAPVRDVSPSVSASDGAASVSDVAPSVSASDGAASVSDVAPSVSASDGAASVSDVSPSVSVSDGAASATGAVRSMPSPVPGEAPPTGAVRSMPSPVPGEAPPVTGAPELEPAVEPLPELEAVASEVLPVATSEAFEAEVVLPAPSPQLEAAPLVFFRQQTTETKV